MRSKLEFKSFERIKFETAPLIIKVAVHILKTGQKSVLT